MERPRGSYRSETLGTLARPLALLFLGRIFLKFSMVLSTHHHLKQRCLLLPPIRDTPEGSPVLRKV